MKCRIAGALALALTLSGQTAPGPAPERPRTPPSGYEDVYAGKKRLLVIADLSTGNQSAHMAVSHAVSVIEQIGRTSGAYVTFIRTDTDWVTKQATWGKGDYAQGGSKQARGKNLDYFDAVLFYTNGETEMTPQQKQDLLDFIAKDGKGFIGLHTAAATAYAWPEYGDMLGGVFDNHPWMIANAKIIVERPESPMMQRLRTGMVLRDEHYQMRMSPAYSRDKVDVLARIDTSSVDLKAPMVHRTDGDFPIAWIKDYGRGRVFYTGLGHTDAAWDDPRVRTMTLEAIKWAINGGETVRPHPLPAGK
ncbi:MAG: ThuA domain-containing protein [Sphingomonadales bacterium]|nr:ThuA domain-containing protein [Sphingomonadales bacterium]